MKPHTRTLAVLFAYALVFQVGCKKPDPVDPGNALDNALASSLIDASGGRGTGWYLMPESDNFSKIPQDPANPLSTAKVELGKLLYHETGLALNPKYGQAIGTYSCASCHHAPAGFQANMAQGISDGGIGFGFAGEGRVMDPSYPEDSIDVQPIRTPSALNTAYQEVMLWNGQFGATGPNEGTDAQWAYDSPKEVNHLGYQGLESQAIAGLEVHRMEIDPVWMQAYPEYMDLFDQAFSDVPANERISRENAGLAIAAYERTLLATKSPFQQWLRGNSEALTDQQKRGAVIFFGKAQCSSCHNGPALNSMEFHALGMKDFAPGAQLQIDPSKLPSLGRGEFTQNADDDFKFKVPQLYNLKDSPFFGHGSSFTSLTQVLEYKNEAVKEHDDVSNNQLAEGFIPLDLTQQDIEDIVQFIEHGLYDPDLSRYVPDALPSGNCFPNNDATSQTDLGCQ